LPAAPTPPTDALRAAFGACRRHFVAAAVFSALLNVLFLAPTIYMLQVYDRVVPTRGVLTLVMLTLVLFLALGSLALLDMVRARLLVRAGVRLDRQLAGAILDATLALPTGGDILTKQAMREFDVLRQTMTGGGVIALFDAPWVPLYILVCFLLHPVLGVVALAGGATLLGLTWLNEKATRTRMRDANEAANHAYLSQEYSAAGSDVVRSLGMRQAMVRRHLMEREESAERQTEANFAGGGYMAATKFARSFLQSLALGVGAWLAVEQKISAGSIFAASLLVSRALAPIEQVLGAWKSFIHARGAWRTLNELLAQAGPALSLTQLKPPTGKLEVGRLTVLNAARDGAILQGVSFKAEAGEIIGVIGASGAGKSTLMRMIAGASKPDQGDIRFDGAEMADWDPERLARFIGYMPQDSLLFAGTVKENIARFRNYLDEDAPGGIDAMVIEAAEACGAHDMILRLPQGYDTVLGWGGRGLSAGQAQRIALARALFGEPRLLILDEPNAHLDMDGEVQLAAALNRLRDKGVTTLVVAHRAGVLAIVDKLMVLRDGRMEAFGARDEVVQRINPGAAPRSLEPVRRPTAA
jgi:PrtD family type I secretion system ABC transporter